MFRRKLRAERDAYREYYLATEENFVLSSTVGTTKEEVDANHERYNTAIDAVEAIEARFDASKEAA